MGFHNGVAFFESQITIYDRKILKVIHNGGKAVKSTCFIHFFKMAEEIYKIRISIVVMKREILDCCLHTVPSYVTHHGTQTDVKLLFFFIAQMFCAFGRICYGSNYSPCS